MLYTKVLETQRRVLGEEHPDTVGTMSNLAVLYVNEGKNADAELLSTKTVKSAAACSANSILTPCVASTTWVCFT